MDFYGREINYLLCHTMSPQTGSSCSISSSHVNKHWNRPQPRGQSHNTRCVGRISIEREAHFYRAPWPFYAHNVRRVLYVLEVMRASVRFYMCTQSKAFGQQVEGAQFFISFLWQAALAKTPSLACICKPQKLMKFAPPTDGRTGALLLSAPLDVVSTLHGERAKSR